MNCNYYLPLLLMKIPHGIDQSVGSKDDARALGPLCAHQVVLSQQNFTDVFGTSHTNDRFTQKVCFKHVAMPLSPRNMKTGPL